MLLVLGILTKEEALVLSAQFAGVVDEKRKELEALKAVPSEAEPAKANGTLAKGSDLE